MAGAGAPGRSNAVFDCCRQRFAVTPSPRTASLPGLDRHAAPEISLGLAARRAAPEGPPQEPSCEGRGYLARRLPADLARRACRARSHGAAARLDFQRMVQPGELAGHRHAVLSRPSAADAAGKEIDHRRRGRHLEFVHEYSAPRSRPCGAAFLQASSPAPLAAVVRRDLQTLPALLSAEPRQPQLRPAFAAVVRAEPSRRGFRRDFCSVAAAALELAHALYRLAGVEEAQICRRADAGNRRQAAVPHQPGKGRSAQHVPRDARRVLQEQARALSGRSAADL